MTENEQTIAAFCAQFTPPLRYVKTERINMVPMPDAWQTSGHDDYTHVGYTVVAYGGGLHAFIEAAGPGSIAANAGSVFARALGLLKLPPLGEIAKDIADETIPHLPAPVLDSTHAKLIALIERRLHELCGVPYAG